MGWSKEMGNPLRVMWLINHTTFRNFELEQFRKCGVAEIFLPKCFPYDEGNLSATVTFEYDSSLKLSHGELALLNSQDWYGKPSEEAWQVANKHFDVVFLAFFPDQILEVCRSFHGAIVLRPFGLPSTLRYSDLMRDFGGEGLVSAIKNCGRRFFFGIGYEHLADQEDSILSSRALFLPVGLKNAALKDQWQGEDRCIYFVCPRINTSPYFKGVYERFKRDFAGHEYRIGGAQPIKVDDPNVLGFVADDVHARNMVQSRLMFYHSQEPNHIHYHPFEAIRAGMPLVFMAGGMLDRMGGIDLPGRCKTVKEARSKIQRILNGDARLIQRIRDTQPLLLEAMKPERCEPAWREGFARIVDELALSRRESGARCQAIPLRRKRIAVILPIAYRGGTLRGAQLLAQALYVGSQQYGEGVDVVFLHPDDAKAYPESDFSALPREIKRRPFVWRTLTREQARHAMRYAGHDGWEPTAPHYVVPDDGICQLQDCDVWLFVSDRLVAPVLPIKPRVMMIYDCLQRYEHILPHGADQPFINAARAADLVLTTTKFTYGDVLAYTGVEPRKVRKVPMLAPIFQSRRNTVGGLATSPYFVWTTNAAPHKNHHNALEALRIYFEELDGVLDCYVTGVGSKNLLSGDLSHLKAAADVVERSHVLRERVLWKGDLPDSEYKRLLESSKFLWHAGRIDNGTFSVIEAAWLGVPALSSDYPAMREIDQQFSLALSWMDADSPEDMARELKTMEVETAVRRGCLPSPEKLAEQNIEQLASAYWSEVRRCL